MENYTFGHSFCSLLCFGLIFSPFFFSCFLKIKTSVWYMGCRRYMGCTSLELVVEIGCVSVMCWSTVLNPLSSLFLFLSKASVNSFLFFKLDFQLCCLNGLYTHCGQKSGYSCLISRCYLIELSCVCVNVFSEAICKIQASNTRFASWRIDLARHIRNLRKK